jgi:3',5'-cyclic AMP phosphodiesterase CpdA
MLIAQLSDPHVCAPGLLYKGVADSNRLFSDAIRHLQQLDRQPDLVLITGDLTDEGRPQEYSMFRELIGALALPHLLMPGNHDHRENFRQAFAEVGYLPKQGALTIASTITRSVSWRLTPASRESITDLSMMKVCGGSIKHFRRTATNRRWWQSTTLPSNRASNISTITDYSVRSRSNRLSALTTISRRLSAVMFTERSSDGGQAPWSPLARALAPKSRCA